MNETRIKEAFLELLRCGMWGRKPTERYFTGLTPNEWTAVYRQRMDSRLSDGRKTDGHRDMPDTDTGTAGNPEATATDITELDRRGKIHRNEKQEDSGYLERTEQPVRSGRYPSGPHERHLGSQVVLQTGAETGQ